MVCVSLSTDVDTTLNAMESPLLSFQDQHLHLEDPLPLTLSIPR